MEVVMGNVVWEPGQEPPKGTGMEKNVLTFLIGSYIMWGKKIIKGTGWKP